MRRLGVLAVFGALLIVALSAPAVGAEARTVFKATLSGDQVAPPADARAEGRAIFKVGKDGASQDETSLDCLLTLKGVEYPTSAEIRDGSGAVLVTLFPAPPATSLPAIPSFSGLAVQLTIDEDSDRLASGVTLAEVIASIEAGEAYVVVTTAKSGNGPIRGKIE